MHVWILAIDTKYGTDLTASASYDLARSALMEFVARNWEDEDGPIPEDQGAAIDAYFEGSHQDYYTLESATVQEDA